MSYMFFALQSILRQMKGMNLKNSNGGTGKIDKGLGFKLKHGMDHGKLMDCLRGRIHEMVFSI